MTNVLAVNYDTFSRNTTSSSGMSLTPRASS